MITCNSPDIRLMTSLGEMTGPFSFCGLDNVSLEVSDCASATTTGLSAELTTVSLEAGDVGVGSCCSSCFVGDGDGSGRQSSGRGSSVVGEGDVSDKNSRRVVGEKEKSRTGAFFMPQDLRKTVLTKRVRFVDPVDVDMDLLVLGV